MVEEWHSDAKENFENNLTRVRSIVEIYDKLVTSGQGRSSVQQSELLRAAVVLLHATLEDLLRTIARKKLPQASEETLKNIPLQVNGKAQEKFTLGALTHFRDSSVNDVLQKAVDDYLDRSNYNNINEIAGFLKSIGVNTQFLNGYGADLTAMTGRRHLIVHRADKNQMSGKGQHRAASISKQTVMKWLEVVENFGEQLLSLL